MIKRRAIAALVVSSVAILSITGPSGIETNSVAQPTPVIKTIPPGIVRTKPEIVEGEVLVKYRENDIKTTDPSERARRIRALGESLRTEFHVTAVTTIPTLGMQRLKLPPGDSVGSAIQRLKRATIVEFAEPNYKIYRLYDPSPRDKYWKSGPISLWGMDRIGMKQAWDASKDNNVADTIVIAVLDSGIDYTHEDLKPNMWKNPGEVPGDSVDNDHDNIIDDVYGADFCWRTDPRFGETYPTGNPRDSVQGHGTAVAGVIGAVVDNPGDGGDSAGYVAGVHRKAKLMALKILCDDDNDSSVAGAIEAITYAWEHGATVLNASWYVASGTISSSTGQSSSPAGLKAAIKLAGDHNALFVAAAGNSSDQKDNDLISIYPANYGRADSDDYLENVMAVAATMDKCANGKQLDVVIGSPTYGKCADGSTPTEALWAENPGGLASHFGVKSVHIASPGWFTYSTFPLFLDSSGITNPSGTSMAAPHVAGCAALLQAKRAATNPSSPFLPKDLRDVLMNNGDPISGLLDPISGLPLVVSGKRLNCYKAFLTETSMGPPAAPTGLIVK